MRPGRTGRLVVCHLGNGCSAAAVVDGRAVACTMGFTPLEGLVMGTRPGNVDPGILLDVLERRGVTVPELRRTLQKESGLLGISGVSSDYRRVEAAADAGVQRAQLALDVYANGVRSAIGSLSTTMGGLDALVFTAGVGENSARLRSTVCAKLAFLGVELDEAVNEGARPDAELSTAASRVGVLAVHTRENLMIARETRRLTRGK